MQMRNWQWWKLYTRVKPLLTQARAEDDMKKQAEEFEATKAELAKVLKQKKELEEQNVGLTQQKNDMFLQLQAGGDTCSDLEEKLSLLVNQKGELNETVKDLEDKLAELECGSEELLEKLRKLEDANHDMKKNNEGLELNLQKSEQEKQTKDNQIRTLNEEMSRQDENVGKLQKDKKGLEETIKATQANLAAEEDKCNHLNKLKQKMESTIDEVNKLTKYFLYQMLFDWILIIVVPMLLQHRQIVHKFQIVAHVEVPWSILMYDILVNHIGNFGQSSHLSDKFFLLKPSCS